MVFGSSEWYEMVSGTLVVLCHEELGREPDPSFFASGFYLAREQGYTSEQLRAWIQESDEWKEKHPVTPPEPPVEPPVEPEPSPVQRTQNELQGTLRTDGKGFLDNSGYVIPVFLHAGDLFAIFTVDPAKAEEGVAEAAKANYQGIRSWVSLNNLRKESNPWFLPPYYCVGPLVTPDYREKTKQFALLLDKYGLKWHWVPGGLDDLTRAQQRQMFETVRDVAAEIGADKFGIFEACNECRDTTDRGDDDPKWLDELISIIRQRHPDSLYTLSSYTGTEDPVDLIPYNTKTKFVYVHGYRGGHISNKSDHRWTLAYEMIPIHMPTHRLLWDGEPCGPWTAPNPGSTTPPGKVKPYVSVQENDQEYDDESVAIIAAGSFIGRSGYTMMSGSGVRYTMPFLSGHFPGMLSVPRLAALLPRDLHTFDKLCHGGRRVSSDGWRVLEATDDCRTDHAVHADGRFVVKLNSDRGGWHKIKVVRPFTGVIIHPGTGEQHPIDGTKGEINVDMRWGRIILGKCL